MRVVTVHLQFTSIHLRPLCASATHATVIVQVPFTGGDATPLSTPLKQPRVLDLSREGTELLIANDDGYDSSSLWVQPVVGGSPRRIVTVPITDAKFGRDGKSIIYGSDHDVYSVNRDGSSGRKVLTANAVPFGFRFPRMDGPSDSPSMITASIRWQSWRPPRMERNYTG